MAKLVLFNKPYDVLCQFSDEQGRQTLADYIRAPELKKVYPAGRLDRDSEGLVLLTDSGPLQHQIAHPKNNKIKTYWVQVEGDISDDAIRALCRGVQLKDGLTKQASATRIPEPELWPRTKPVRFRANLPTSWIALSISEGRNRQVRRMTAAVGFPTLRLVRVAVDQWQLFEPKHTLKQGEYRVIDVDAPSTKPKHMRPSPRYKTAHNTRKSERDKHKRSKPKTTPHSARTER